MGKEELIAEISKTTGLSAEDSRKVLDTYAGVVEDELKEGDMIQLTLCGNTGENGKKKKYEVR